MGTYTIGQVAERSGFSTSALRYYERHGLLDPVDRSDAGYRLYDDTSIARLEFIDRAKQLGCTLEEISELADLWAADDCAPVQARLHELVTAKISDARRRSAELVGFTAQLQEAAAHLDRTPSDGPCGPECACTAATDARASSSTEVVLGERHEPPIACTLSSADIPGRMDSWAEALTSVIDRQALDGGVRLALHPDAPLEQVATLMAAEHGCCSFFSFALTVDDRGTALEVRAPHDAADLVTAVFGAPA